MTLRKKDCPWASKLKANDFISSTTSYSYGKFLNLFEDRIFEGCDKRVGSVRYYVYDPTHHGAPKDKTYPVLFALHGAGGSRVGKLAINWAAAEMFATPEYQQKIGGAYIVCPLANETGDEYYDMTWMTPLPGGSTEGYAPEVCRVIERYSRNWPELISLLGVNSVYTESLFRVLEEARTTFAHPGKNVLMGTSAGGYGAWRMLLSAPERFAAAVIMAGAYLPSTAELQQIKNAKIKLLLCHALYDECVPFDLVIRPNLVQLCQMPDVTCYFPELVHNGDHGVSSNISGIEMGQHCINNEISQNLIYDDGTLYDERFPDGATGWISGVAAGE